MLIEQIKPDELFQDDAAQRLGAASRATLCFLAYLPCPSRQNVEISTKSKDTMDTFKKVYVSWFRVP